jgi:hypothetical protein
VSTGKQERHPGRSPGISHPLHHVGPPWTGPRPWSMKRGPSPWTFPLQNKSENPKIQYFLAFLQRSP